MIKNPKAGKFFGIVLIQCFIFSSGCKPKKTNKPESGDAEKDPKTFGIVNPEFSVSKKLQLNFSVFGEDLRAVSYTAVQGLICNVLPQKLSSNLNIMVDVSKLPDGDVTLCVWPQYSTGFIKNRPAQFTWTKDTVAPAFSIALMDGQSATTHDLPVVFKILSNEPLSDSALNTSNISNEESSDASITWTVARENDTTWVLRGSGNFSSTKITPKLFGVTDSAGNLSESVIGPTVIYQRSCDSQPAGTLDERFGTQGFLIFNADNSENINPYSSGTLSVMSDERLVFAGYRKNSSGQNNGVFVTRYDADGKLPDPSFGTNGLALFDIPGVYGNGAVTTGDGNTFISVYDGRVQGVVKVNPEGGLASTFGVGGVVWTNRSMAPDIIRLTLDERNLFAVGQVYQSRYFSYGVQRLDPITGAFDASSGNYGFVSCASGTNDDFPGAFEVHPESGAFFTGGVGNFTIPTGNQIFICKNLADGQPDNTFGSQGKKAINFGSGTDLARALRIQPDGKILVGGAASDTNRNFDWILTRLNADGSMDNSFASQGKWRKDFAGADDEIKSILLLASGDFYVIGRATIAAKSSIAVMKFLANGTPDLAFGSSGLQIYTHPERDLFVTRSMFDKQDRLLVGVAATKNDSLNAVGALRLCLAKNELSPSTTTMAKNQ